MDSILPDRFKKPDGYKNTHSSESRYTQQTFTDNNIDKIKEKLDQLDINKDNSNSICSII